MVKINNDDNKFINSKVVFRGLTLDNFQKQAINDIVNNKSVVVCAGTGTGKTLIADYLIDFYLKKNKRIIYTSPIKALSNQKYRDFSKIFGDKIGLMTGDITINGGAQVLIMTTEIYRNMLVNKETFNDLSYVIFDEIHYINDFERGTIWEEAIIFSPENVRFLCLSATIPNSKEFASWIQKVQKHDVTVVKYEKRAVPLEHYIYIPKKGIFDYDDKQLKNITFPKDEKKKEWYKKRSKKHQNNQRNKKNEDTEKILSLVNDLNNKQWLPAIIFSFSRKQCFNFAKQVSKKFDFIHNFDEKREIARIFDENINRDIFDLDTVRELRKLVQKGIGVHNAGLMPSLKESLEVLFSKGLIKVLFTTETFAVGINMPAKCVCFEKLKKFDGFRYRDLQSREYMQMAGRAGRRGIDEVGYVISAVQNPEDLKNTIELIKAKSEKMESQFKLSYNTIINLCKNLDEQAIKKFLKSNFSYYQNFGNDKAYNALIANYSRKIKELKKHDYIDSNNQITRKGAFATYVYSGELIFPELVFSGIIDNLSNVELFTILNSIIYEPKFSDYFNLKNVNNHVNIILNKISKNRYLSTKLKATKIKRMYKISSMWLNNCDFIDLLDETNLLEGDILRLFRQSIDILRQLRKASEKYYDDYIDVFEDLLNKVDRDIIKEEY